MVMFLVRAVVALSACKHISIVRFPVKHTLCAVRAVCVSPIGDTGKAMQDREGLEGQLLAETSRFSPCTGRHKCTASRRQPADTEQGEFYQAWRS
jgi:hypothetical protein